MPKNFDAEKVSFSKPIVNEKYKSKSVYVNYDGKKPLIFKTPTMNCPFGFTVFGEDDGYVKYNLECSFNGMDTNTDMKSFFDALQGLDNSLVDGACKNSLAWFTKPKLSHEVATEFFQSNLRYSIDKDTGEPSTKYAPRFKVRIPVMMNKTTGEDYINCKIWRELSWDLSGWSESELNMLGTNDLQLEAEYRGLEVELVEDEEELRSSLTSSLLDWASNTSAEDKSTQLKGLSDDSDELSMYKSNKASHPVHLTELKPSDFKTEFKTRFRVSLVTKCRSIWFTGGKFGCSWDVLHMKLYPTVDKTPTLSPSEVNLDGITFTEPKENKYGSKSASLKHNGTQLRLKLPKMPMPFGLSKYNTLDISFREKDDNEEVNEFLEFLNSLDEKMVESACENSFAWFKKKKMTTEIVEALWKPSLRYSTDRETGEPLTKYAPRFSVRLPIYGERVGFKLFNASGEEYKSTDPIFEGDLSSNLSSLMTAKSSVEMTVRCSSLWLRSGQFGLTWEATHVTIYPNEEGLDTYVFNDDDDRAVIIEDSDEDEEEEVEVEVEEEEEEEESEDELEVKPPTPPPAKKRRGRKKKTKGA